MTLARYVAPLLVSTFAFAGGANTPAHATDSLPAANPSLAPAKRYEEIRRAAPTAVAPANPRVIYAQPERGRPAVDPTLPQRNTAPFAYEGGRVTGYVGHYTTCGPMVPGGRAVPYEYDVVTMHQTNGEFVRVRANKRLLRNGGALLCNLFGNAGYGALVDGVQEGMQEGIAKSPAATPGLNTNMLPRVRVPAGAY